LQTGWNDGPSRLRLKKPLKPANKRYQADNDHRRSLENGESYWRGAGIELRIVEGSQIDNMGDQELLGKIEGISIFARVTAEHKMRLVNALKNEGSHCGHDRRRSELMRLL